ncbi:T-box transcription factor TBX18-like [Saccostrea cucullata]|uniref:T-box transcription factor TBX18-like n=1 Tax=Saccostrea cuccullata TaxID=36930 RepID=UPI002ED3B38E
MLSAKAKAFSIDSLLAVGPSFARETSVDTDNRVHDLGICHQEHPTKKHISKCFHPALQTITDDTKEITLQIELCQNDLWHAFHNLGTEMIITKTGRRMFPAIRVKLHGLDPGCKYSVSLEFTQIDKQKYRYVYHSSKWMVSGLGDDMIRDQIYRHPDSPADGAVLESQIVSFERIKLTNNDSPKYGQISLLSMQRFVPRLHVHQISHDGVSVRHFMAVFPQTSFTAVTAYQNQEITKLKIARNPFAKGFREAGKNRSSLEAMLDSLSAHGVRPHCNTIPNKRQQIGPRDETENSLALFLSGKEMKLFTNVWNNSSCNSVATEKVPKYPYLLHVQPPSSQLEVQTPCINFESGTAVGGFPNQVPSEQAPACIERPPVQRPTNSPVWCSKLPLPVSPICDFQAHNVSSHLLHMFRYSLNK